MSFIFTQKDDCESLAEDLQLVLPRVIQNRIAEFELVKEKLFACDFEAISQYCHRVAGVATSYRLFQLDEIIRYLHKSAKERNVEHTLVLASELEQYFNKLKSTI